MHYSPITGRAAQVISKLLDARPGRGRPALVEPRQEKGYFSITAHGRNGHTRDKYSELRLYEKGTVKLIFTQFDGDRLTVTVPGNNRDIKLSAQRWGVSDGSAIPARPLAIKDAAELRGIAARVAAIVKKAAPKPLF